MNGQSNGRKKVVKGVANQELPGPPQQLPQ